MRKSKLYLETSVWNFLLVSDAPDKKSATEMLFREIEAEGHSIFISEIVLNEIIRAPGQKRELLVNLIHRYDPLILEDSHESQELISYYLKNELLSENHLADLGHIAISSANDMDVLVSWNMRHMVKLKTRTMVNALNQLQGFRSLDICTPEEVIGYGFDI